MPGFTEARIGRSRGADFRDIVPIVDFEALREKPKQLHETAAWEEQ
jgi:hypothetical protein